MPSHPWVFQERRQRTGEEREMKVDKIEQVPCVRVFFGTGDYAYMRHETSDGGYLWYIATHKGFDLVPEQNELEEDYQYALVMQ